AVDRQPTLAEPAAPPVLQALPRPTTDTVFEVRLLGTPGLLRDGEPVTAWRTNLVRDVLFFLALRAGTVVRTEALVDALMPDADYDRSLTALRHAVYHLRRLFAPLRPISTVNGGYTFEVEGSIRCDVHDLQGLLQSGRPPRGAVDLEALEGVINR